jgi:hypothetical protein
MGMRGLGRLFDIGLAVAPVDINTSDAATGKRIYMGDCAGVTVIAVCGVGGADDMTFDIQQHTAYTSGTSADMDAAAVGTASGITAWHLKAETALDNDESWVEVTQSVASECTVVGATYGTQQKLVAIYVPSTSLADGYTHMSVNVACTTSTAQLMAVLYLKHDLNVQRKPTNLGNLLNPGAANA